MSERITQAGYDWSAVAENVAAGQIDVEAVMVAWINSPEHLENIMGDYTMFGSAYAFNRDGTYQHYWTQDFGSGDAEQCDGASDKGAVVTPAPTTVAPSTEAPETTIQDATQNVDLVQEEADVTPAPTTVTPATEAPVTPAPTTPAPETPIQESPAQADCESNF
ncbi:hypothetical protein PHPALM_18811 [Phytophthora palmivora]|uniref:SCP domain-containing protein n=1 Tax=Phytophthora palmivora TaxID=4796 RepID=A0A2P4XIV5_9STRA|nr:hypothetical protein PHPALM_18811 [Phytophthora palmivora]